MPTQLQITERNLATLRRCMADLDALLLPGQSDLQQAALCTLAALARSAYTAHHAALEAANKWQQRQLDPTHTATDKQLRQLIAEGVHPGVRI